MHSSGTGEIWIFGYGSLMWRPGFSYLQRELAVVDGYHRGFCIRSTHHRGSPERPGLVLGLDRGRMCMGMAYRIDPAEAASTIAYLRERELIYGVYRETRVTAHLKVAGRRAVPALAYTVERHHPSYVGRLALEEQARRIRGARGISGDNLDYLINTLRLLQRLAIRERDLERLLGLAGAVAARGDDATLARMSVAGLRKAWCRSGAREAVALDQQRRFGHRARMTQCW